MRFVPPSTSLQVVKKLDKNGDGIITPQEFKDFLGTCNLGLSEPQLQKITDIACALTTAGHESDGDYRFLAQIWCSYVFSVGFLMFSKGFQVLEVRSVNYGVTA